MGMGKLLKSQSHLDLRVDVGVGYRPLHYTQSYRPTAGESPGRVEVRLTDEMWRDLGMPDSITVTIEPGDTLNKEEPDVTDAF